jgi:hypothetical protein
LQLLLKFKLSSFFVDKVRAIIYFLTPKEFENFEYEVHQFAPTGNWRKNLSFLGIEVTGVNIKFVQQSPRDRQNFFYRPNRVFMHKKQDGAK